MANKPKDWRELVKWAPVVRGLKPNERAAFPHHFGFHAHPGREPPEGDWRTWLIMAGRGFGKTRAGAEWVRSVAEADRHARIALVAASLGEARAVMVEGESGLLACCAPGHAPAYEPSLRRLAFPNGAQAFLYSAAEPESLRGPQHSHASKAKQATRRQRPRKENAGSSRPTPAAIGLGRTASSPAAKPVTGCSLPRVTECGCWTDQAGRKFVIGRAGSAPSRLLSPPAARSPMPRPARRSRN